jgi:hypothetical protein
LASFGAFSLLHARWIGFVRRVFALFLIIAACALRTAYGDRWVRSARSQVCTRASSGL